MDMKRSPGEVVIPLIVRLPPAVILVGGLGTRLKSVVSDRPKAMAVVAGKPFLTHQLEWLHTNGVGSVLLCVGYKGQQIVDYIGDGSHLGLVVSYSWEHTPLGTAGALAKAMELLPEEFLVINGDTFTTLPLGPLWEAHHHNGAIATLAVTTSEDSSAVGGIELAADGRITSFREKESGAQLVSMGIYAISRRIATFIPKKRPCSLENDVFPYLPSLYGHVAKEPFIDIGTPTGYLAADVYLSRLGE
jgi:D-glycero-alpha-D-manno-heptose 1-phosphate guanylyltransferase